MYTVLIPGIDSMAGHKALCLVNGIVFWVAGWTHIPTQFRSNKLMQRDFIYHFSKVDRLEKIEGFVCLHNLPYRTGENEADPGV